MECGLGGEPRDPVPASSSDVQGPGCGSITVLQAGQACAVQYFITPVNFAPEWLGAIRVDQNLGDKDRIYGRFPLDHGTQPTYTNPMNPLFSALSYQPENQQQISWTHVFSPNATDLFTGSHLFYQAGFYANIAATDNFFAPSLSLGDGSFYRPNPNEGGFPFIIGRILHKFVHHEGRKRIDKHSATTA
jgi:hypothetical protein